MVTVLKVVADNAQRGGGKHAAIIYNYNSVEPPRDRMRARHVLITRCPHVCERARARISRYVYRGEINRNYITANINTSSPACRFRAGSRTEISGI